MGINQNFMELNFIKYGTQEIRSLEDDSHLS
jgi:hypothetical protein